MALAARRNSPAILDSAAPDGSARGRWTVIACDPVATFEHRPQNGDPFECMRRLLASTGMLDPDQPDGDVGFTGGWIGYFGYEAGRYIEHLPARTACDVGLPVARFALYDSAAVYDHREQRWTVVATTFGDRPGPAGPIPPSCLEARMTWWKDLLAAAARLPDLEVHQPPPPYGPIARNVAKEQFIRMVQQARDYIAAGDIFQVNLARRESTAVVEPAFNLYLRLRRANPGGYSAFMSFRPVEFGSSAANRLISGQPRDECAVLSSSPELFLDLCGRQVATRPIKGTRPRSSDARRDELLRLELASSGKDRAELAMIVDLERNDLGRVCEFGTIQVAHSDSPAAPFALERHPTVHHLVATVTGRLREGCDAVDLLRAGFPGGSITGAPKVRAMEIIDELEPTQRSVYTGAIGYFCPGRMVMNIAIRTILQAVGRLHWYGGGGIVADSDPVAEYDETCAKLLGMRRALGLEGASG